VRDPGPAVLRHFDLFDAFRLVAAVMVIYSHSFPLTGESEPVMPLVDRTYGSIAVGAFFVMSGFLITASWQRRQQIVPYSVNRAARIFPGLLVVVVVSALVLGPLATDLSAGEYFADERTWDYLGHTGTLLPVRYELPGVFEGNPYPTVVNGSLWSLPYEVLAYVVVLALGILGALHRRRSVAGVAVVAIVCHLLVVDTEVVGTFGALGLDLRTALTVGLFFVVGCAAYVFLAIWSGHVREVAGCGLVLATAGGVAGFELAVTVGLAALIMATGTLASSPARRLRRYGDPSFGTYVWAFPIQQVLAAWGTTSAIGMFLMATPVALIAGYVSWHVVEQPALALAKARGGSLRRAVRATGTR
jgi:peptidoglycan/LPS O-acetylase OafA/YrhL